jgi:hypothetical protein
MGSTSSTARPAFVRAPDLLAASLTAYFGGQITQVRHLEGNTQFCHLFEGAVLPPMLAWYYMTI